MKNIEYSISPKKEVIVALSVIFSLTYILVYFSSIEFTIILVSIFVIIKSFFIKGNCSKVHEQLHIYGFTRNNKDIKYNIKYSENAPTISLNFIKAIFRCTSFEELVNVLSTNKNHVELLDGIPVNDYAKGLIMPVRMYRTSYIISILIMMIIPNFLFDFYESFIGIGLNLYYFLIFILLNPVIFSIFEYMFDVLVLIKLLVTTLGKKDKYMVKTPNNSNYGFILIPIEE